MERAGNFSSSSIYKLVSSGVRSESIGKPFYTYVKQKNRERKLGRSINSEAGAKSTDWGKFVERRTFDLLPIDYVLVSDKRLAHPDRDYHTGAPDLVKGSTVGDVKCPWTLNAFCDKVDALSDGLQEYKSEFPEDYWQHISNSILLNANGYEITRFEAIIYAPYLEELPIIREMLNNFDGDASKFQWINYAANEDLPYLINGGVYKNLNIFSFEIPQADVDFLNERIIKAGELLIPRQQLKFAA